MMKRFLGCMALILTLLVPAAFAEDTTSAEEEEPVLTPAQIAMMAHQAKTEPMHITVGNTTKVNGSFFTKQFGNNTSDIDVRMMLHGYNLVYWDNQLEYVQDPQVVTGLARSQSSNGTVYTVTLAQDLLWDDGKTKITAADYAFTLLLVNSPEIEQIGADKGTFSHIVGWDEYNSGESKYFSGVRVLNDYQLSITVKPEYEPYFYELAYLSIRPYPISVIAPGCEVKDNAKGVYLANSDKRVKEPIFTAELLRKTILDPETGYLTYPSLVCGPYRLVSYDRESGRVEFEINEYYKGNYDGVTPYFDTVSLIPIYPDSMFDQFANDEVDILNKVVDKESIQTGMSQSGNGSQMYNYARLGYGFFTFSCEKGPQQFLKVRQALAYSFDGKAFTEWLTGGYGLQVYGLYGLGQWTTQAAMGALRPENQTEEEAAAWDAITLDNLERYDVDMEKAKSLLIEDGWTLNEKGKAFDETKDTLRYKKLDDGTLMPLSFDFARCKNNKAADMACEMLETSLKELGGQLNITDVTFNELLDDHYRINGIRKYDMCFMATNFVKALDQFMAFYDESDWNGAFRTSGLSDDILKETSWEMHNTEPMDLLTYLTQWQAFQERYSQVLPTLPIYSNVYFDFTDDHVQNYDIQANRGWPEALLYAYWGEPETEEEEGEEFSDDDSSSETDDGDIIILE